MGKLDGKNILITGGSTGIGKASLDLFIEEGAEKIILADYNEEASQSVVDEHPEKVVFVKTDVGVEEDIEHLFDEINKEVKKLDIVFNNAGVGNQEPTHELSFEDWRRTVAIDLDGLFLIAQKAIKLMLNQDQGGVIVNTASMYGTVGAPTSAAYTAAKGGVINLTRTLGLEYAEAGIRVNSLAPGFIDTPILGEDIRDSLVEITPMKRLGRADEIAKAALFLASDDSSFMTGATLVVDGGYTAG